MTYRVVTHLLFGLACGFESHANVQIERIGLLPDGELINVRNLRVTTERHGFLTISDSVWRTDDAGKHWTNLSLPPHRGSIVSAQFLTSGFGWLLLDTGLYITDSSGDQWKYSSLPVTYPSGIVNSLYFLSDRLGWIGAGKYIQQMVQRPAPNYAVQMRSEGRFILQPAIFRTLDGGKTWVEAHLSIGSDFSIRRCFFKTPKSGFAVGETAVYHTIDGGLTWRHVYGTAESESRTIIDLFALDDRTAWVSFDDGTLIRTEDSGRHWATSLSLPRLVNGPSYAASYIYHLWFSSRLKGLALSSQWGHLYLTRDGGKTWSPVLPEVKIVTFDALDLQHIWLATNQGLLKLLGLDD